MIKSIYLPNFISIHAPLAGSDLPRINKAPDKTTFQSTLPSRGATSYGVRRGNKFVFQSTLPSRGATVSLSSARWPVSISIHAPLAGSDIHKSGPNVKILYFNPRSPRGERPSNLGKRPKFKGISIHAPLAGSDRHKSLLQFPARISIHAPLAGSDPTCKHNSRKQTNFNPRSPRGERPSRLKTGGGPCNFNPRSPRGERRPVHTADTRTF